MTHEDRNLVIGALDSLGLALTDHNHVWTEGEREIYDQAIAIMKTGELTELKHPDLIDAARNFLKYLTSNVGDSADWPLEIRGNSTESAFTLAELLNKLEKAAKDSENSELMTRAMAMELLKAETIPGTKAFVFHLHAGVCYWRPGSELVDFRIGHATSRQLEAISYLMRTYPERKK